MTGSAPQTAPQTPLLRDIAMRLPGLSPQLRLAAQHVLDHPEDVAMHSLRTVARSAEVTPPTMSRLARALNCRNYEELRERCRIETKRRGVSLSDRVAAMQDEAGDGTAVSPFVVGQAKAAVGNIETMLSNLDIDSLRHTCDRLIAARSVTVVGTLSAAALVEYLGYMASMTFPHWHFVSDPGSAGAARLADVGRRDAVIAITFEPYARRTVDLTRLAAGKGCYVVGITDTASSPLARIADSAFLTATLSPQFFPSHVAAMVFIESMMGMLIRRGGHAVAERVRTIESIKKALGENWEDAA